MVLCFRALGLVSRYEAFRLQLRQVMCQKLGLRIAALAKEVTRT